MKIELFGAGRNKKGEKETGNNELLKALRSDPFWNNIPLASPSTGSPAYYNTTLYHTIRN